MATLSLDLFRGRKVDPRVFQVLALLIYSTVAREFFYFERSHFFTLFIVSWGVGLDLLIGRFIFKSVNIPYTPMIAGFATSILIDSPHLWIYLLSVSAAVLIKAFLTYKNRHFLNPANSGVTFVFLLFPTLLVANAKMFNFNPEIVGLFLCIGTLVALYARVIQISILWLISFFTFALIRHFIYGVPFELAVMPMKAATFMLFTFHMITDPATTPRSFWGRGLFCLLVAALDAVFRHNMIPFGIFYSLFIVSFLNPVVEMIRSLQFSFTDVLRNRFVWGLPILAFFIYLRVENTVNYGKNSPVTARTRMASELIEKPLFTEQAEKLNLKFTHVDPVTDEKLKTKLRIMWVAPGLVVFDANRDGYMDLLAVNSNREKSQHALFINNKGAGFSDQTKDWGLDKIPKDLIPNSATPFDYNNDGLVDLFFAGPGCSHLYENTGERFIDVTEKSQLKHCGNSIAAIPLDFDLDGHMDLFVMRYFSDKINLEQMTPEMMGFFGPDNFGQATNGGKNILYQNVNGKFIEASSVYQDTAGGWTWDAGLADIRSANERILVVGNDFGYDNYIKVTKDKFIDITDEIVFRDSRSSMTVSFGDVGSANPLIVLTNIFSPQFAVRGNFAWQYDSYWKKLVDKQVHYDISNCGWAWGTAFGDFNRDGLEDLYMSNGMVSRSATDEVPPATDPNYFKLMTASTVPGKLWKKDSETIFKYIDVSKSFAGNQRDCLFMRNPYEFENRSLHSPDIKKWDGRAVAMIDHNNSGKLNLAVSVQEGKLIFLENQSTQDKNWLGVQFEESPSLTLGARLKFLQNGKVFYRWYQNGKSGFLAYSDPRVHVGLPSPDHKVDIEIQWADGVSSQYKDISPGQYIRLNKGGAFIK